MATSFIRLATACTLGVALMMSSASVIALEKTATKEVDQASTDLNTQMKITAFSAAVQAAIDQLMARVNLFDGRIDALEAWRTGVDTSIANILSRLAALEARAPHLAYLYDTWRPWVEGQLSSLSSSVSSLNTRVTNVESRGSGGTLVFHSCYQRGARYGPVVYCDGGDVVTGVCSSGKDANCRQVGANYTTINCCKVRIQ